MPAHPMSTLQGSKVVEDFVAKSRTSERLARDAGGGGILSRDDELRMIEKTLVKLRKNPAKARRLAVAAGIYTTDGRLRKAFGGKA